mgnify:CR=1 FL=1
MALTADGLEITVPGSWIIEGEDRLSYTTILRIVECCREHHWRRDVTAICDTPLDSILVTCEAVFHQPILAGSRVAVKYRVAAVGTKSYDLQFFVSSPGSAEDWATVRMRCVFLDPAARYSCIPPQTVANHLRAAIPRGKDHG